MCVRSRMQYWLLLAILLLAAALRLYGLLASGVVYHDDLRAYSGPQIVRAMTKQDVSIGARLAEVYRISIEGTGARPALAWLVFIPAVLGFTSVGELFVPFALFGVINILLVWVLCRNWFDEATALYAALWMAVSAAHVNYSRSALPPTPAIAFMALGIVLMFKSDQNGKKLSWRRIFATGWCFALSVAFHPAYLVYLVVPLTLLAIALFIQKGTAVQFLRGLALYGFLLLIPTIMLIALHDAPSAMFSLLRGEFERSDLLYLAGIYRLSSSPTIYSEGQEGLLFWPLYILNSEGWLAIIIITMALLAVFLLRPRREDFHSRWLLLSSFVGPYVLFSIWPNVTSLGRLYAPLLLPLACLVGLGLSRITLAISRSSLPLTPLVHASFALLIVGGGLSASRTILLFPGGEPVLGQQLLQKGIKQAIGFVRTDTAAFAGIEIIEVYQPADIEQIRCTQKLDLIILSPASFYLVLRHQQYLFDDLQLEPVITFPNPYRAPARLMEGQTPSERQMTLTTARYANLGLFRIKKSGGCPTP